MSSRTIPESARKLELPLGEWTPPLDWGAVFGRGGAAAIEIGTGNGYFLEVEAGRLTDWNFIGIEREAEFYWKMVKRCARAGLTNVRATRLDALEFLREWVPPGSLGRVYCYFSDPWPKRRHAARRVVTPDFPALLAPLLAPGGELRFKTDVGWYFNFAVTAFRAHGGWKFSAIGRVAPPNPRAGDPLSNFERRARDSSVEVWGFHAARESG
jgi:tRNA (guanine-N7-)-methyltransferase